MQRNFYMADQEWDKLISDVAYQFSDITLKRGFQYYKQDRVHAFKMISVGSILALVEGGEDYSVTIDLDTLSASRCSCPVQHSCKHMAAVLMKYAEQQGRLVHMLANAKTTSQWIRNPVVKETPVAGGSARRKKQLEELAALVPSGNVEQWREYLALLTAPLAPTVRNSQYTDRALAAISGATPALPPASGLLYKLHAHLFVLESLLKPAGPHVPGAGASLGYYTSVAVSELQKAVTDLMKNSLPLGAEPEAWPRVSETLAYLRREMLSEPRDRSREQPYYSLCYDLIWRGWIAPNASGPAMYLEELEALRQAGEEAGISLSRHSQQLAESRMYFYLNDDKGAWELLDKASERPGLYPDELMSFLAPLAEAGHWSRLALWLAKIGPLLTSRLFNLKNYAGYWEEAVRRMPETEPRMWDTLIGMLPLSREIYEEMLLDHGRWQEWMDYQLSSGKEPANFRVSDLQPIEKNAPELLLPFYHQAAERFVLEKNRHGYKAAVKLLKRLSKLYKKLKREERWEQFLDSFTSRYSRLRALQEELRKGKLIP
ncbi:SWIM zinc finger family protein [Paenibacillus sp. FSL L8-0470]|uniref:SWIM zinc finger family protein n=1 Tax=Paenibacillus sp. FSL L8-0470 TaxID=2954688 RepID=UPI0030F4BDEE